MNDTDTHCYRIIEWPDGQLCCKWMAKDAPLPELCALAVDEQFSDFTSAATWLRNEIERNRAYYLFLARAWRLIERQQRGY